MTPQHTDHRWLAVCLSTFLGILSMNAAAVDPGTVKGKLTWGNMVYTLRHVHVLQRPEYYEDLWIYATDAKLPAAATQDASTPEDLVDLQSEGRLHGVILRIHPTKPDLKSLALTGYASQFFEFSQTGGAPKWARLLVDGKRVVGTLKYAGVDKLGVDWSLDLEFSAPVFRLGGAAQAGAGAKAPGGSASAKTLTGAQAQKSPQADVFLAYEKALLWQGIDAASAHMTPERLTAMQGMLKQYGDEFKQMQTEKRKSTPQGEARRKQIEKVVVDGDSAVLEVRNGPNDVDQVPLAKTKDGWKVTTR